jgi:hypothetical protein
LLSLPSTVLILLGETVVEEARHVLVLKYETSVVTLGSYSRAFDSVQRECIRRALEERGLPKKIINLIREG